jgi:hypothetical protein
MDIKHITGATHMLGAPPNWDPEKDGACGVLPVRAGMHSPGVPCMVSEWKPSPEEIAVLAAGGSIFLSVVGATHPVVAVYIADEKAEG